MSDLKSTSKYSESSLEVESIMSKSGSGSGSEIELEVGLGFGPQLLLGERKSRELNRSRHSNRKCGGSSRNSSGSALVAILDLDGDQKDEVARTNRRRKERKKKSQQQQQNIWGQKKEMGMSTASVPIQTQGVETDSDAVLHDFSIISMSTSKSTARGKNQGRKDLRNSSGTNASKALRTIGKKEVSKKVHVSKEKESIKKDVLQMEQEHDVASMVEIESIGKELESETKKTARALFTTPAKKIVRRKGQRRKTLLATVEKGNDKGSENEHDTAMLKPLRHTQHEELAHHLINDINIQNKEEEEKEEEEKKEKNTNVKDKKDDDDSMDLLHPKHHFFFRDLPMYLRKQMQLDDVALYSVTDMKTADAISKFILDYIHHYPHYHHDGDGVYAKERKTWRRSEEEVEEEEARRDASRRWCELGSDFVITDGTACVGGNVISFCKYFRAVQAVEQDAARCKMLEANLETLQYKNVTCWHADYTQVMMSLQQDIVFLDPPWGGPEYAQKAAVDLFLGDLPLHRICEDVSNVTKYVVLKVPLNFNLVGFQSCITPRSLCIHRNFRKMLLLVLDYTERAQYLLLPQRRRPLMQVINWDAEESITGREEEKHWKLVATPLKAKTPLHTKLARAVAQTQSSWERSLKPKNAFPTFGKAKATTTRRREPSD